MKDDIQISNNISKKIDKFIISLSSDLSEDKETIKDFREEMKTNFMISFKELMQQGYNERQAFSLAVSKFGDMDNLKEDLSGTFKLRNRGNKISFFIAVISLLISISCFAYYEKVDAVRNESIPNDIQNELSSKIQQGSEVNQNKVEEIMKNHKKELKLVALYKEENNTMVLKNLYPSGFDKSKIDKALYQFRSSDFYFQNPNKEQYEMKTVTTEVDTHRIEYYIGIISFLIYWGFFTIWACTYAFNIKRLNLGFGMLFFFFNILGYFIFKLSNKVGERNRTIFN